MAMPMDTRLNVQSTVDRAVIRYHEQMDMARLRFLPLRSHLCRMVVVISVTIGPDVLSHTDCNIWG